MPVISLAAADSGISTMQTQIDTIGNNVANADSDGYQEADVQFSDILTQQLAPGSGSSTNLASTDPSSIGAGSQVSAMQTNFNQGAIVQTGVPTDAAIQGNGFFVVDQGGNTYYTRAGNFQLDVNGTLSTASGGIVQGWAGNDLDDRADWGDHNPEQHDHRPPGDSQHHHGGQHPLRRGRLYDHGDRLRRPGQRGGRLTMTYTPTATANQWTMQASVNGSNLFSSGRHPSPSTQGGQLESYSVDGGAATDVTDQGRDYCDHPGAPDRLQLEREGDRFRLPRRPARSDGVTQYTTDSDSRCQQPRTATPREACSPGRSARAG